MSSMRRANALLFYAFFRSLSRVLREYEGNERLFEIDILFSLVLSAFGKYNKVSKNVYRKFYSFKQRERERENKPAHIISIKPRNC